MRLGKDAGVGGAYADVLSRRTTEVAPPAIRSEPNGGNLADRQELDVISGVTSRKLSGRQAFVGLRDRVKDRHMGHTSEQRKPSAHHRRSARHTRRATQLWGSQ